MGKIKKIKIYFFIIVTLLFNQIIHSSEEVETKNLFSGTEFFQENSDTLEPNIVMQQNLKRDVERRRSLEPMTETKIPITRQDSFPPKARVNSLSKLKERVIKK